MLSFTLQSILSNHAKMRLSERFSISEEDLLSHLNFGKIGVVLGCSFDHNIQHIMVWSDADDSPIIVIRNKIDGVILTVLTLEMYKRDYAQRVTEEAITKAFNQLKNRKKRLKKLFNIPSNNSKLIICGLFKTEDKIKVMVLGHWEELVAEKNILRLGENPEFWNWVVKRIEKKGVEIESLKRVTAGFTKADRYIIPYSVTEDKSKL